MTAVIKRVSPRLAQARRVLSASDAYYLERYPPETLHLDTPEMLSQPGVYFAGAFVGEVLAGIGAVRQCEDDVIYGEIRRLFVLPEFRGRGISRRIMHTLEAHLLEQGITLCRLESGTRQPEALALYESLGYSRRGPFGSYGHDPLSVYMEKRLA